VTSALIILLDSSNLQKQAKLGIHGILNNKQKCVHGDFCLDHLSRLFESSKTTHNSDYRIWFRGSHFRRPLRLRYGPGFKKSRMVRSGKKNTANNYNNNGVRGLRICVCVCVCVYTHTHTHTHTQIYYCRTRTGIPRREGEQQVGLLTLAIPVLCII